MLKQRVITAALLLPIVIWLFASGPSYLIAIFFLVGVAGCSYETSAMLVPKMISVFGSANEEKSKKIIILTVTASVFLFIVSTYSHTEAGRGFMAFGFLGSILLGVFSGESIEDRMAVVFGILISLVYGLVPWLAIWDLYNLGDHSRFIFLLLAVVWAGDTGAYFGGRFFGKHKLYPILSPKKTWEGSVAGILSSVLAAYLVNALFGFSLGSSAFIVTITVVTGAFAQAGDLVESCFKRFAGVKDSGTIFPGHGGVLDRVDGILMGAPVLWLMFYIFS